MSRKAMDAAAVERERTRMLAQARRLTEQDGFKRLSMRKLAAGLGVTATTIYRYFASKDELFLSLLVTGFNRLHGGMARCAAQARSEDGRLKAAADEYIRFGIEDKGYYSLMFGSDYPECREYADPREAALAQEATRVSMDVIGLVGELAAQAAGRPVPVERVVQAWMLLHGFVSLYHSDVFEHLTGDTGALREATARRAVEMGLGS